MCAALRRLGYLTCSRAAVRWYTEYIVTQTSARMIQPAFLDNCLQCD